MGVDIEGEFSGNFQSLPQSQMQELVESYALIDNTSYPIKISMVDTWDQFKVENDSKLHTYKISGEFGAVKSILENLKVIEWNSYNQVFNHYRPITYKNRKGDDIAMSVTIELSLEIDVESIFERNGLAEEQ